MGMSVLSKVFTSILIKRHHALLNWIFKKSFSYILEFGLIGYNLYWFNCSNRFSLLFYNFSSCLGYWRSLCSHGSCHQNLKIHCGSCRTVGYKKVCMYLVKQSSYVVVVVEHYMFRCEVSIGMCFHLKGYVMMVFKYSK